MIPHEPPNQSSELNDLLERLTNVIYLLKIEPQTSSKIRLCLDLADKDLERLKTLIRQLRDESQDNAA